LCLCHQQRRIASAMADLILIRLLERHGAAAIERPNG
jgi:hypothetical protein